MSVQYCGRVCGDVDSFCEDFVSEIDDLYGLCVRLASVNDGDPGSVYAKHMADTADTAIVRAIWRAVYEYGVCAEQTPDSLQDELDDEIPF